MNIYLIRHGETYWNREGRLQGSSDIELTPFGVELAGVTGDGLAAEGVCFDRIYTSPLVRATVTAQVIAERTMGSVTEENYFVDDRLKEMCFGQYEGRLLSEVKETCTANGFWDPDRYHPDPSGESYQEMFARVCNFMDEVLIPLEREGRAETVLIVCHGTIARAFLSLINHVPAEEFWKMSQPNCSVNLLRLTDGQFSTIYERKIYYEAEEMLNRGIL